jgi:lipopolysaccharide/colanic/teichoic acid biosynthesis glycosyltransferase
MTGFSTLAFSAREAEILAGQEDPDAYYRERLLHDRIAADLQYVQQASLARDLVILGRTGLLVITEVASLAWPTRRTVREPSQPVR